MKYSLGKLPLPEPPGVYLPKQRERHQISGMPLDESSVALLENLPRHHRDPFDRMLVCQALRHGVTMMTRDKSVLQYPVPFFRG